MKKKWLSLRHDPWTGKILLKMKLTLLFLCVIVLGSFAASTYAQSTKLTLDARNATVKEILNNIEDQSEFRFFYSGNVDVERKTSIMVKNGQVFAILDDLFKGQNVQYEVRGRQIALVKGGEDFSFSGFVMQQKSVSGVVLDAQGEPLPGVTVVIKGTTNGTVTDTNGNYQIPSVESEDVLQFSFVGMKAHEVVVGNQSTIDVTLESENIGVDEVVVVGYGTQQRRNIVSSISTVDSKTIEKVTSPSFTQALQGAAPGLQVSTSSGNPDAGVRMLIRGVGSINTAAEPLILVDGIPVASGGTNSLSFLNPSDIDNISVLKDASATAIYGSRGANGVILVTTKTGKKGGGFTFSYEKGFSKPIIDVELAGANEWRSIVAAGRENSGLGGIRFEKEFDLRDKRQRQRFVDLDVYNTTNVDWMDLYSQTGETDKYSFSTSDVSERSNFYLSGQYRKQTGNLLPEKYETFTGRFNFDYKISDFVKIGVRYTYVYKNRSGQSRYAESVTYEDRYLNLGAHANFGSIYGSALPIYPEFWPDNGEVFDPLSGNNLTFSTLRDNMQQDEVDQRNLATGYLQITPIKNLVVKAEVGVNYSHNVEDRYVSGAIRHGMIKDEDKSNPDREFLDYIYTDGVPLFYHETSDPRSWNTNITANYNYSINEKHNLGLLLGVEALEDKGNTYQIEVENASSFQVPSEIGAFIRTEKQFMELSHYAGGDSRFFSAFSRLNYDYNGKYILQGTLRYDGSSKFSPEDRFSWFPSISAGWVASEEQFLETADWLTNLKLRGSYGITGNANIPGFLYIDSFSTWANYPNKSGAAIQEKIASQTIQWEKSKTTDVAIEYGIFKNRLSGSLGFYNTNTTNLLMNFPTAASIGIYGTNNVDVTSLDNVGEINNRGFEFELKSFNVTNKDWQWTTNFNFTYNKNKVVALYPGFDGSPTQLSFNGLTTVQIGEPMGTFYLPTFGGYDEYGNPLIKEIDPELAEEQIYEYTGENVRSIGSVTNKNRVIQYGKTGLPKWYGGLNNSVSYKGFTLGVLLTFQGGNYLYDNNASLRRVGTGNGNYRKGLLEDTWTPENPNAKYPVLAWENKELNPENPEANANKINDNSTNYLKKGDFARLRTISLSYDVPRAIAQKVFMKGLNVYVNMNNVATISGYKDYDPEQVNTSGDAQTRNIGQGIAGPGYWQAFSTNFGVNITF
jgi:TonB-linked SusC/RagA family outer membrane protein